MALPWILLAIAVGIIVLGLAVVLVWKNRKKRKEMDYRVYYNIGIVWFPLGIVFWIVFDSIFFFIMGVVFLAIGLANKDKWGKPVKLSPKEKKRNKILVWIGVVALVGFVVLGIVMNELKIQSINSFDECVAAGNPVMESYPRQCRADGKTFTEDLCKVMSISEARQIAIASECGDRLKDTSICNSNTNTWWIDLDVEKEGCNPACVVNIVTRQAEINWRCTGLIS